MHAVRLGQGLAAGVTFSVMLLMAGMVGLGVAREQRVIALLELDVRFGGSHVVALRRTRQTAPGTSRRVHQS